MKVLNNRKIRIGVDMESIDRFVNLDRVKNKTFLERVYSVEELHYCYSKKKFAQHLCARFVAKEAIIKAMTGVDEKYFNYSYSDILILNNKLGVPEVSLKKKLERILDIQLSISHNQESSIAFAVIIEK